MHLCAQVQLRELGLASYRGKRHTFGLHATPSFSPPAHPLRGGGGDSSSGVSKSMTQAESPDSSMSAFRVKAAGTQFTCFTGTKVRILTQKVSLVPRSPVASTASAYA